MKKLNQEEKKKKKAIEDFLDERTSINREKSLEELCEALSIINSTFAPKTKQVSSHIS